MTESKKEYLAWINLGICGTRWRAESIREAVETCCIIAAQDFSGIRGETIRVGVYDVTEHDSVYFSPRGEALTADEKETKLPPLFIAKVEVPKIRKNGKPSGEHYRKKVQTSAFLALQHLFPLGLPRLPRSI